MSGSRSARSGPPAGARALRQACTRAAAGPVLAAGPLLAASLVLGATGCSSHSAPVVPLPPGELRSLVPQPNQEPGFLPLLAQSGPAGLTRVASLSSDPSSAATSLAAHGFQSGYVVEYLNAGAGDVLTVEVNKFATADGARADLEGDLAAAPPAGSVDLALPRVGDASQVLREPNPSAATGQLVTVRTVTGRYTFLVAASSRGTVNPEAVRAVAVTLVGHARSTQP